MKEVLKFNAEVKESAGKGASRSLRAQGKLPVVIYGGAEKPEMVALSQNEFYKEYIKGGIKNRLVEIDTGKKKISAIAKDVHLHPVTDKPLHVDFLRVGKDTAVKVAVTIHLLNEDKSPGVKKGGIANIVSRKINFFCHPSNILQHLDIDIGELEIGASVHIEDLKLPEGVKPVDEGNFTLLSIIGRTEEVEAPVAVAAEAAPAAAPAAK